MKHVWGTVSQADSGQKSNIYNKGFAKNSFNVDSTSFLKQDPISRQSRYKFLKYSSFVVRESLSCSLYTHALLLLSARKLGICLLAHRVIDLWLDN